VIRTVIVGGGMVGLTLARLLRRRGHTPVVLERAPTLMWQPRGFMLGYQGFDAFEELGILRPLRAAGWDVAIRADGTPTGVAVDVGEVMRALAEDVPVAYGESVVDLVREGDRVCGVVSEGPGGRATLAADLVVACDGRASPVRAMAGLEAEVHPLNDAYLSWLSPATGELFAFRYLADGGMVTALGWPGGSSGSRRIDPMGAERATRPPIDLFRRNFAELLPSAAAAVAGVASWAQVRYVEPRLLRLPRWWTPGVVAIGDSAHTFGPDTGVGAGIGLGDAHALAEAIARHADADAACAAYAAWREPAVRPYEHLDPAWRRMGEIPVPPDRPAAEAWPPG
jgi:2-polyprenyl-6-methoxyphenol hydroxylase-like FAD-dependent oxidoreductase